MNVRDDGFFLMMMFMGFILIIFPFNPGSSVNDDCIVIEDIIHSPEIITTDSEFVLSYIIRNECKLDMNIVLKVQDTSNSRDLTFENNNLKSGVTLYDFTPNEERVYYNTIKVKRSIAQYDFPINISVYGYNNDDRESESRESEIINIKIAREM